MSKAQHICRLCGASLCEPVIDLGVMPLANAYLKPSDLDRAEPTYPLRAFFCGQCGLLQLAAVVSPEVLFSDYPYFSSVSSTLLRQAELFTSNVIERLELQPGDQVVEVASNDGYLLQFLQRRGLRVLGIEPARNIAAVAARNGIPTDCRFFDAAVAREVAHGFGQPRLLVANNVVAHVPDLNNFLAGLKALLAPGGTLSLEFHHLLRLVEQTQFDNIYHEHFQYFSLCAARNALGRHALGVVDVEEIAGQGGSLRVYARHAEEGHAASAAVARMMDRETAAGLGRRETFRAVEGRAQVIRTGLRGFLEEARAAGTRVACFGAAAKGNTLLNYSGVGSNLIDYAVDSSPQKQGLFLPGSRIPIHAPNRILRTRPDYVMILPWNLCDEITAQMAEVRDWGGKFVVAVPELHVLG